MKGIIGEVISVKMTQTANVLVKRFYRYPLYGKIVSRKSKIHAHNAIGAKCGQVVMINPCRPYAKTVAYEITKIVDSAHLPELSGLVNSVDSKKTVNSKNKRKTINKAKK